jgi:hypothetical protein
MAAQLAAEFPATNAGWTATIDRFAFHREMRRLVEGRAQGLRVLETFRKPGISIGGIDTPTTCKNHRMRLTVFSISRSNNHSTLPSTGRSPPNALPIGRRAARCSPAGRCRVPTSRQSRRRAAARAVGEISGVRAVVPQRLVAIRGIEVPGRAVDPAVLLQPARPRVTSKRAASAARRTMVRVAGIPRRRAGRRGGSELSQEREGFRGAN